MATADKRSTFGVRLASLRKSQGFTQAEFARLIGISRRALAYYEAETSRKPDGDLLMKMARYLDITVDQLLGMEPVQVGRTPPKEARLMKKLKKVSELPVQDQKAVLRYVDALLKTAESSN